MLKFLKTAIDIILFLSIFLFLLVIISPLEPVLFVWEEEEKEPDLMYIITNAEVEMPEPPVSITNTNTSVVFVLCYHTFIEPAEKHGKFNFSLEELKKHIEFLKANGFKFISTEEFLNRQVEGVRNVLITIDDGSESVYRAFKEVLKEENIKPLLAIYPGVISKRKNHYFLNWQQLKELAEEGCYIASHGYFHQKLSSELFKTNREVFVKEIVTSKKILEENLNIPIKVFVYPYGIKSEEAISLLKQSGYEYAFSVVFRYTVLPEDLEKAPYDIPRYTMFRTTGWKVLTNIVRIAENMEKKRNNKGLSRKVFSRVIR